MVLKRGFGIVRWKQRCTNKKMSEFVKPSFEAFMLLAYENCYETYKKDGLGGGPRKFKWTSDRKFSSRNKGWPDEAIVRYNDLHARIVVDRNENKDDFDVTFMEEMSKKYSKKRKPTENSGAVPKKQAVNDLNTGIDWASV